MFLACSAYLGLPRRHPQAGNFEKETKPYLPKCSWLDGFLFSTGIRKYCLVLSPLLDRVPSHVSGYVGFILALESNEETARHAYMLGNATPHWSDPPGQ